MSAIYTDLSKRHESKVTENEESKFKGAPNSNGPLKLSTNNPKGSTNDVGEVNEGEPTSKASDDSGLHGSSRGSPNTMDEDEKSKEAREQKEKRDRQLKLAHERMFGRVGEINYSSLGFGEVTGVGKDKYKSLQG
ncbi:hypothetical protein CC80DRAFT_566872 [Byssothecium circinans]|uniref:Uncharacterized protein n=1 Tax=Byssothecium circinans TaxID=147558 RepID=A0A6A5TR25_9PLEO|nr:hypothetical protein CC80DRAFT_566872 [Byssothecium circinans]